MQSSRRGVEGIRRFLPYISAVLIIYGVIGVAVNLRFLPLLIEALTGWLGPGWSAFAPPLQLSFLEPLQAHFDARPWLPWAAWLVGVTLLPLFVGRKATVPAAVGEDGDNEAISGSGKV